MTGPPSRFRSMSRPPDPPSPRWPARSRRAIFAPAARRRSFYTQTLLPNVAAGLQAAGRASGSIDRMIEMKVSFDTDRQRALDDTRNWAALALSPEEKVSVEDAVEIEKLADALPVEPPPSAGSSRPIPTSMSEKIKV